MRWSQRWHDRSWTSDRSAIWEQPATLGPPPARPRAESPVLLVQRVHVVPELDGLDTGLGLEVAVELMR
jgi:hypothetical protein